MIRREQMFRYRRINVKNDRAILPELHCRINYESETPYARKLSYDQYREKWLKTSQPEDYLSHLAKTMKDKRTIAEILEDKDKIVGYLWVTFTDIKDYNITIASVMGIIVVPSYQRRGIGLGMMNHIEETSRKNGATLLRSDTGIQNVASQKLHEKAEFKPCRINYEKILE